MSSDTDPPSSLAAIVQDSISGRVFLLIQPVNLHLSYSKLNYTIRLYSLYYRQGSYDDEFIIMMNSFLYSEFMSFWGNFV